MVLNIYDLKANFVYLIADLGLMATISAVLYANTEHPNLKELFPNWNDRCKQILKRWRSLCNEKKAPFLQKAKDNRSALRQRREQNKVPMPPKPQKQEDMARVWKQQPKLKEDQPNMFVTYSKCCSQRTFDLVSIYLFIYFNYL